MNMKEMPEKSSVVPTDYLQNNLVRRLYRPPLVVRLEIQGIESGQTNGVLEATSGLMLGAS